MTGFVRTPIIPPGTARGQGKPENGRAPGRRTGRLLPLLPLLLLFFLLCPSPAGAWRSSCPPAPVHGVPLGEHYSPAENLEAIDVAMIDRARRTIDIAMYSFTDRAIAEALLRAAKRGVRVRIYRDRIQVRDRGDKTRRLLDSRAGKEHITVRVKRNSSRNIMHLKAYLIDGKILRTGSANWSPPGEGAYCRKGYRSHRAQQDNNLFLTDNPKEAARFERTFDRIFARESNRKWRPGMGRKSRE